MKKQRRVKVIYTGMTYSMYESWLTTNFIRFHRLWHKHVAPEAGKIYRVIGTAPHRVENGIEYGPTLALITDLKGHRVYIIGVSGIETVL